MKRISTSLFAGALLGLSALAQAQSHVLELGAFPTTVRPGQVITVQGFLTPLAADTRVPQFQAPIAYDGDVFSSVAFSLADIPNADESVVNQSTVDSPAALTGATAAASRGGLNKIKRLTVATPDPNSGAAQIGGRAQFGTFTFTVKAASAGLQYGASQTGFTSAVLSTITPTANRAFVSPTTSPTTFTLGVQNFTVVPGPSSLAVFAMGGLAPAAAMFRRRRAAK